MFPQCDDNSPVYQNTKIFLSAVVAVSLCVNYVDISQTDMNPDIAFRCQYQEIFWSSGHNMHQQTFLTSIDLPAHWISALQFQSSTISSACLFLILKLLHQA